MSDSRMDELQQELSRRKELESELASRKQNASQNESMPDQENPHGLLKNSRSGMDAARDVGAGLARSIQNLGSGLLEGGEYVTRKGAEKLGRDLGHPVKVPYWNAREFMGLEGNRPIDFGKNIQSKNPDAISQMVGQFGPALLAGGPSALRQMLTQGAYAASQAKPNEQNALGLLPSGRGGAAIEGSALAGLPFAMPKLFGMAKNALAKYSSPETSSKNFIAELGKGKSIPENIKELSQRMRYGQKTAKEEALIPKREVMAESGNERIFPSQVKGKNLSDQVSSIFSEHPKDVTPERLSKFNQEMKTYYNGKINSKDPSKSIDPYDMDRLIEKGEEIFEHPGLSEKDINKLDQALIPEKPVKGEYLKIKNADEHYSDLIQEAHDKYVRNPTFRNSDRLRSRLFKRINELNQRVKAKTITDAQELELRGLTKARSSIIKDQDKLISTFSPENRGKYGKFNETWRNDVRAYEDAGTTIKNLKNGHLQNITPTKLTNAFAFPELKPELNKILKDIGPSGVNNIIYNELGRAKDAKHVLDILENLERTKGFSQYMTPELKSHAQRLRKQLRNKNFAMKSLDLGAKGVGLYGGYKGAQNVFGQ